jgi:hypothetical protein
MKIRPVWVELFNAERQADMMRLIVAFRNFVNAPKNRDMKFDPNSLTNVTINKK